MFPINTVIAWHETIMNFWDIIINTPYYLPLGHYLQQSPTCTRVQIIQLHLLLIITPYSICANDHACLWKRLLTDRIVQIRNALCKSIMSPCLTLLYHQNDNFTIIRLAVEWDLSSCVHNDVSFGQNWLSLTLSCILENTLRWKSSFLSHTINVDSNGNASSMFNHALF